MTRNAFQLLLLLLFFSVAYSQDYQRVDGIVENYPSSFDSPLELADKIKQDFSSENDKARAVFTWIALNISYDMEAYLHPKPSKSFSFKSELERDLKLEKIKNKEINTVFKKHKGVCHDYSLLYYHLAELVGLHVQIIEGDSKTRFEDIGRKRVEKNHAWNAVMIDGMWRLIDVTWGAGATINDNNLWVKKFNPIYFDTDSNIFFAKHLPVSKVWNNKIIDEEIFLNAPLFYDEYFIKGVEIVEPVYGVIDAKGNQKINFKIKNRSKNQEILCVTKEGTIRIDPNKIENNLEQFEVDCNKRSGGYITLYVSGFAIATFKVVYQR